MKAATRKSLYAVVIAGWIALSIAVWIWIIDTVPGELEALSRTTPESPQNIDLRIAPDLRITGVQVGILADSASDLRAFVPQDTVPIVPGQRFGWLVWIESTRQEIDFTEVFRFQYAGPDQTIGLTDDSRLDEAKNQITTDRTASLIDGTVGNFWVITEGDPPGPHSFDITIDGVAIATLDFHLEPTCEE